MKTNYSIPVSEWQKELNLTIEELNDPRNDIERVIVLRESKKFIERQITKRKSHTKEKIKNNLVISYWNVIERNANKEATIILFNKMVDNYFSQMDITLDQSVQFKRDIENVFMTSKTRMRYGIE